MVFYSRLVTTHHPVLHSLYARPVLKVKRLEAILHNSYSFCEARSNESML
jgi:hypothetical protein